MKKSIKNGYIIYLMNEMILRLNTHLNYLFSDYLRKQFKAWAVGLTLQGYKVDLCLVLAFLPTIWRCTPTQPLHFTTSA